jgi:hypothetical protein
VSVSSRPRGKSTTLSLRNQLEPDLPPCHNHATHALTPLTPSSRSSNTFSLFFLIFFHFAHPLHVYSLVEWRNDNIYFIGISHERAALGCFTQCCGRLGETCTQASLVHLYTLG